jgi:hypothetical protein
VATDDLMIKYLGWRHDVAADGSRSVLFLDLYLTHGTEKVREMTEKCDFELLYVPIGATGEYQSLDRRIFDEPKARARAEFAQKASADGSIEMNSESTLDVLYQLLKSHLQDEWQEILRS